MRHVFAENVKQTLLEILRDELSRTTSAKFSVAFVTMSGLALLEKELTKCVERGIEIEFLVGLDFGTTDGNALRWLRSQADGYSNVRFFCFRDPLRKRGRTFHPKLYLLKQRNLATAIIGSSNLTNGGLKENIELNVIVRDRYYSEAINAVRDIYADFLYQGQLFTPNESYIEIYDDVFKQLRRHRIRALSSKSAKQMLESLEKKEEELPKPMIRDPSTLTGWQKLVYERIPSAEFTTESMYRFEKEFRKIYPKNRHIEDKIRQVLQQLRDEGFLKHLGRGRWIKREK